MAATRKSVLRVAVKRRLNCGGFIGWAKASVFSAKMSLLPLKRRSPAAARSCAYQCRVLLPRGRRPRCRRSVQRPSDDRLFAARKLGNGRQCRRRRPSGVFGNLEIPKVPNVKLIWEGRKNGGIPPIPERKRTREPLRFYVSDLVLQVFIY